MKTLFDHGQADDELQASIKIDAAGSGVLLPKHGSVQLHDATGWTVKATAGSVWITQDQDLRDVVLEAGESYVIERGGNTLLFSLEDSRICVARRTDAGRSVRTAPRRPSLFSWRFLPSPLSA